MNFLPKSDSASKDNEELDLPAVRLFAVSEKSELNLDDSEEITYVDEDEDEMEHGTDDHRIESELDVMLQEQIASQTGDLLTGETDQERFLSTRILKIRDKQETCAELKSQIAQGTTILRDLSAKAELITRYLDSAEVELTQLESTETSAEKLVNFNRTLSLQYEEAKEKLDEQQTLLDFLESEKAKSRNTIEMARKEIARLLEYKREQAMEMTQIKSVLAKADNDRSSLQERLDGVERTRQELETESEARLHRIHQFENLRKGSEKTIAAMKTKNEELEDELQRSAVALSDMRLKQSDANSRVLGLQTQLEEMSHELSGLKREAENNTRLKEKRIVELETRLTGSVDHGLQENDIDEYAPKNKTLDGMGKSKGADKAHTIASVSEVGHSAA